MPTVERVGPH
jgi:hypothetical protein